MFRKLENFKAAAVFRDLFGGSQGKLRESPGKIAGNTLPNREMLQILGFRAPGKANLPGTLGWHSRDLVCTFRAGCFLKSTVPAFSSFSECLKVFFRHPRVSNAPMCCLPVRNEDPERLAFLRLMKGRPTRKKTTHPNKNTVCANNFGTVCTNCPPFVPLKQAEKRQKSLRKLFVQTVLIWVGGFLGGSPSLERLAFRHARVRFQNACFRPSGLSSPNLPADTLLASVPTSHLPHSLASPPPLRNTNLNPPSTHMPRSLSPAPDRKLYIKFSKHPRCYAHRATFHMPPPPHPP